MTAPEHDAVEIVPTSRTPLSDEQSFEDLYEHAPCGHLSTAADGTITGVNQTFLNLTGYTRSQIVGLNFASLLTTASALFYETRCLPVLRLQGEVQEVALGIHRVDGGRLSTLVNSTMRASRDGRAPLIQTVVFDSTQRRDYERDLLQARRAAEASEERAQVLHRASSAFGLSESEEALTAALAENARTAFDATSASVRLLDGSRIHLVAGSHPLEGSEDIDASGPEAAALRSGDVVTIGDLGEAQRAFPALAEPLATARLQAMTVVAIPGESSPLGLLTCFFGRQRLFDDHVLQLHTDLTSYAGQVLRRLRLQTELQRSNERLTAFAGQVSHDLRNPLTAILMSVHLIEEAYESSECAGNTPDRIGPLIERAIRGSNRMQSLIDDLLVFARLGGGLGWVPVDLGAVAVEVLEDLAVALTGATVEVRDLPTVTGDPVQLRAVVQNLVANAAKFTRAGEPANVLLAARRVPNGWRIEVSDRGPGIAEADRERVFEPWARVDEDVEGLGIGLTTCRRIMEAHGGRIGLTASPWGGTTAWFELRD